MILFSTTGSWGRCASFSALRAFCVYLLADLHGCKPLHIRDVGQRPGKITMLSTPFLVMLNGFGKKLQGFVVAALATDHTAMCRIDVAEGNIIISIAQHLFSLFQNARRFPSISFLEMKPAFQHAHHRSHPVKPKIPGQFAPEQGML